MGSSFPFFFTVSILLTTHSLGFLHLGAGLAVGLSGLAAGFAIGVVGDAGVRGTAQQPRSATEYAHVPFSSSISILLHIPFPRSSPILRPFLPLRDLSLPLLF